jgi:hypothetical protein
MSTLDNRSGMVIALTALGDVARRQGDTSGARQYYEEGLALDRNLGAFPSRIAEVLRSLGELALEQGLAAEARERLVESLTIAAGLHDLVQVAQVLEALARLAAPAAGEQQERALRLAGAAAALREQAGQALAPDRQVTLTERLALDSGAQETAWADGQAMTLEQAIAYALEELGDG